MEIDIKKVAEKYNNVDAVWDSKDVWHIHTKNEIAAFIKQSLLFIQPFKGRILNAGSSGNSYDLPEDNLIHVDVASKKISHLSNAIVADIQSMPFAEKLFDLIVCVGSVINYCDAVSVIQEFTRVINDGGYLIIEFENSHTFELLGKKSFNKKAVLVNTFYNGNTEKIWYFSESYVCELLFLYGFEIINKCRFHILSPLLYRLFKNEKIASNISKYDHFCFRLPIIGTFSSNTILLLKKSENAVG